MHPAVARLSQTARLLRLLLWCGRLLQRLPLRHGLQVWQLLHLHVMLLLRMLLLVQQLLLLLLLHVFMRWLLLRLRGQDERLLLLLLLLHLLMHLLQLRLLIRVS